MAGEGMAMTATVSLTREAIDRIIEDHFQQEAAGDVDGTLSTFTDDVVHDVVGDPAGELHGPSAVGHRYGHLFSNVKGEHADVKHRLYGENFVVDDMIWTARVVGEFMGIPGHGRRISISERWPASLPGSELGPGIGRRLKAASKQRSSPPPWAAPLID